MTLRHVWDGLASSWRAFLGGKGWLTLKSRFALAGWVRAVEVTHGGNGWHVHAHTIFFIEPGAHLEVEDFAQELFCRWDSAVNSNGFTADRVAFDVRRTHSDSPLARYLMKQGNAGLGLELARGAFKTSRTPFSILYALVKKGQRSCACNGPRLVSTRCDYCLWREWEQSATGRRQISWSVGMRDLISTCAESGDADDLLFNSEPVLAVAVGSWRRLVLIGQVSDFFDCIEAFGVSAGIGYLRSRNFRVHEFPSPVP